MTKGSNLRMSCRKYHCEYKRGGLDISVLTPCKQKYEMTLNPKIKQTFIFLNNDARLIRRNKMLPLTLDVKVKVKLHKMVSNYVNEAETQY